MHKLPQQLLVYGNLNKFLKYYKFYLKFINFNKYRVIDI